MYQKNVRLLSIFNFLIGFSLFAPLAILYFAKVSGSYALGALVFGITMLASAVFEVPTGVWSDRVGRKGTIILGSWARVLAFVFYAIGLSYGWLVVGAILEGVSRALYSGNNDAFLHDTLSDEGLEHQYDDYLGKTSSTEQLAYGISAILGSVIASFSFSYLLWISVGFQILMLTVSYLFTEPKARTKKTTNVYAHLREALTLFFTNKKLRLLSWSSAMGNAFGEAGYQFRAAFVASLWPVWAIGLSSVLSSFGASLSFFFSGKLIRTFSAIKLLLTGSIYGKAVNFAAYLFPNFFSPLLLTTTSLFYGASEVAKNTLMQKEFSEHQRATMASLNSLFGSILFTIVFVSLGLFAISIAPAKALVILTIASLPTTYLLWVIFRNDRRIAV